MDDPFATQDSFSLDDLKRSATNAAAEAGPPAETVPLRGRGWFLPFQEAAMAEEDEARDTADGDAPVLRRAPYCYLCESWEARRSNPLREGVLKLVALAETMDEEHVVGLVDRWYRKFVQPRTGKHWEVNTIREHMRKHDVSPVLVVTENIRHLQSAIDAHVAVMEQVEEAEGENPKKRRKVDLRTQDSFMKLVRLQTAQLLVREKLRGSNVGGGGAAGGSSKSI